MVKRKILKEESISKDEEIDIIELFIKIWRWKWLIASIVIIITTATFIFQKLSPNPPPIYTVKASLKVGIVGNYAVQSPDLIINTVKNQLYTQARQQGSIINDITPISTPNNNPYNISKFDATAADRAGKYLYTIKLSATNINIDYSIQSPSSNKSVKWAREIGDFIINYHRPIYTNAIKQAQIELAEIKRMSVYVNDKYIKMKLMYENQKYPTSYTLEPQPPAAPDPIPNKRIMLKTTFAFISSLFFGIIISFIIDGSFTIMQEIKKRTRKE